jgi:predicted DCC family thiol-disulfide oxidoreductase YuxK
MSSPDGRKETHDIWLLYDGDCPFCEAYTRLVRLRDALGELRLINARDPSPELDTVRRLGCRIDDGMVLCIEGEYFHGNDCIHRLALLSSQVSAFNRLNRWIFSSRRRSALLYPILRACRNLTVRLRGGSFLGY